MTNIEKAWHYATHAQLMELLMQQCSSRQEPIPFELELAKRYYTWQCGEVLFRKKECESGGVG